MELTTVQPFHVACLNRGLLHDVDAEGGAFRNTTALLSERIKLLLENPAGGQLAQLEKLEALALGVEGKRTLLAVAEEKPALRKVDFARLDQRGRRSAQARRIPSNQGCACRLCACKISCAESLPAVAILPLCMYITPEVRVTTCQLWCLALLSNFPM
jgi:hypothetical protein